MNPSARVSSLDALVALRTALVLFKDKASQAMSSIDLEIRNTLNWLDDQIKHWQAAIRFYEEEVFQAKNELTRRKMMRIGDRPPDTTEQEQALKRAEAHLEFAREKLESTRTWVLQLPEEITEYRGPAGQMLATLEIDFPRMDALLERKLASLEAYVQSSAPVVSAPPTVSRPLSPPSSDRGGGDAPPAKAQSKNERPEGKP